VTYACTACISLILLVGAGRFERPTPCAQGIESRGSVSLLTTSASMRWREIIYSLETHL